MDDVIKVIMPVFAHNCDVAKLISQRTKESLNERFCLWIFDCCGLAFVAVAQELLEGYRKGVQNCYHDQYFLVRESDKTNIGLDKWRQFLQGG